MSRWRKRPESSTKNPQDRTTTESSRRNFLKTAGITAGAVLVRESLWARGKATIATDRNFAFPQIKQRFMITPDQAWEWASFKSQGGPTYAGGAGWKRY